MKESSSRDGQSQMKDESDGGASRGAPPEYTAREERDFYQILGVTRNASDELIRRAYRRKVLECHPDRVGNSEEKKKEFFDVQMAYEVLNDPKKRRIFDKYGENGIGVMNTAGVFSFVLQIDLSFQTFLYVFIALSAVLLILLFFVLISLKYDGLTSMSWLSVFAPLYVFLIIFVLPCCWAASGESQKSREAQEGLLEKDDDAGRVGSSGKRGFYWILFLCFTAFSITFPLHYQTSALSNWVLTFTPLIIMMTLLLVSKCVFLCKTIYRGHQEGSAQVGYGAENTEETHSNDYSSPPPKFIKYTTREKLALILSKHLTLLLTIQTILIALRLQEYITISWKLALIPSWAWAVIGFILILIESLTPSLYSFSMSTTGVKLSNTSIFFIVFIPNFTILLISSAFLYPFLIMLRIHLDNPLDTYYQARLILSPAFILLSLLSITIISFPFIAVFIRRCLLRKFGNGANGSYSPTYQVATGLIASRDYIV